MFSEEQLQCIFEDMRASGATSLLALAATADPLDIPSPIAGYADMKRVMDVVIAMIALAFTAPLFLLIALFIKLDSRGPVFFKQDRTGLNGAVFKIVKFRSMRLHDDEAVVQATRGDTRVSRIGSLLRRSSLDELPQFINVLRGEMSVVGPRPHAMKHDAQIARILPAYNDRFAVKPGITGLAQIRGLRGECHSVQCLIDRLTADREYIRGATLRLDLAIVLLTIPRLVYDSAAY